MPTVTQQATASVYVNGASAATRAKNYSSQATFRVGTSPQIISYLYWNRPFPLGATITSARIEITQSQPNTGTRELDAWRVDEKWQNSKITHNNRPGVTGTKTATAIGSGARGRVITIDVTPQMQEVAAGAPWYGLRVYTDAAATMHFFNHKSVDFGPRLIVEYSTAPSTPSDLSPAGGRAVSVARPILGFGYSSPDASALTAYQVQMNKTVATFSSPDHDSGEVAATVPSYAVPFDIDPAEVWFWRVRVKNASGEWSGWSDPAEFTRVTKGVLAITSPATDPGVVTDPTPPFGWSFSGTQVLYRVIVTRVDDGTIMWDSGEVASSDTTVAYPFDDSRRGLVLDTDYRVTVRITDDVDRAPTAGDPGYVEASRDFTFEFGVGVTPPTDLDASATHGDPRVTLTWARSEAPDEWLILRDGERVAHVPGPDLSVGGNGYEFVDLTAGSGTHTYEVAAIVNGVTSSGNPTDTVATFTIGTWLMTLDGEHAVSMADGVPVLEGQELSTVHLPLGARNPVLITQAVFGRRGRARLLLWPSETRTLDDERAAWHAISDPDRYPRGTLMQLAWTDTSMTAFLFNVYRDAEGQRETAGAIPVGFDFCEVR